MNDTATPIEMLYDKVEEYGNTTIELLKLKAIRKSADVISSLISKVVITISVALCVLILNIGVALWLGDLLQKNYLGFFIVAGLYAIIAFVCYVNRNKIIKYPINNALIEKLQKKYD